MVKLTEIQKMFWGVTLDGGKRYTQTVERSFHISMAALESSAEPAKPSEKHVSVMIQHEKAEFVMCTLEYGRLFQQPLDLNFTEGEEVTFFLNGPGIVHLTGYLMEEGQYDSEMELSDMSEEESEEDVPQLLEMDSLDEDDDSEDEDFDEDTKKGVKKRKKKEATSVKAKKPKMLLEAGDSDDDDSDDESFDMQKLLEGEDLSDSDEEDEEEEEEEEDSDDDQEVPAKSPKTKNQQAKPKQEQKTPAKKENKTPTAESASKTKTPGQNGIANTPDSEEKKKKKKKKKKKNKNKEGQDTLNSSNQSTPSTPATPNQQGKDTPKKRVFAGGVIVEDVKIGHGPEAKTGRQLHMNYVGTLAQNGRQFDSMKGGKTFKFRLGKGDVIRGWDIGMNGMKVGGKRKLTIPPNMGYGKQKLDGIPPNSTLVFEVELKAVS